MGSFTLIHALLCWAGFLLLFAKGFPVKLAGVVLFIGAIVSALRASSDTDSFAMVAGLGLLPIIVLLLTWMFEPETVKAQDRGDAGK